jgi:hypothetical protein
MEMFLEMQTIAVRRVPQRVRFQVWLRSFADPLNSESNVLNNKEKNKSVLAMDCFCRPLRLRGLMRIDYQLITIMQL